MDRTKARWRFETVSDDYGIRVSLIDPAQRELRTPPASAIIGTDWDADRVTLALKALEEIYVALPDPEETP